MHLKGSHEHMLSVLTEDLMTLLCLKDSWRDSAAGTAHATDLTDRDVLAVM